MKNVCQLAFTLFILVSCSNDQEKATTAEVNYSGALRTIMSGNIAPAINLDSLSNKKNLYAIGAMEYLEGEIQIFNDKVVNSSVQDGFVEINNSLNVKAALLVYSEVKEWDSIRLNSVSTKEGLEDVIFNTAKTNGIDVEKPFPFLLEGKVSSLDWHVIKWNAKDSIHTHSKHKASGLSGILNDKNVEMIGFYSTKHKAVFTHHTTNMHIHFRTKDDKIAGHVDDFKLDNEIILKLPKQ